MVTDDELSKLYTWASPHKDAEIRYVLGCVYIRQGHDAQSAAAAVVHLTQRKYMAGVNKIEYARYLAAIANDDSTTDEYYDCVVSLSSSAGATLLLKEGAYVWEVNGKEYTDAELAYAALVGA